MNQVFFLKMKKKKSYAYRQLTLTAVQEHGGIVDYPSISNVRDDLFRITVTCDKL